MIRASSCSATVLPSSDFGTARNNCTRPMSIAPTHVIFVFSAAMPSAATAAKHERILHMASSISAAALGMASFDLVSSLCCSDGGSGHHPLTGFCLQAHFTKPFFSAGYSLGSTATAA